MKDPGYDIRVAVVNALQVVMPNVGVYDSIAPDTAEFPRVIILDVTGSDNDNSKCGWGGDWGVTMKISDARTGGVSSNRIDQISSLIMETLVQTDPVLIIDLSPNFNAWNVSGSVLSAQEYEDSTYKYKDKNIRITYSITEN